MTNVTHIFMLMMTNAYLLGTNKSEAASNTNSSGILTAPFPGATNIGQNGGSGSSASASHNMAGCPKLVANCNFDCLTIGKNGCIICTCTKQGSSMTLSGGTSLTSSGTGSQSGQGSNIGGANNSLSLTNANSPFSINIGSAGTGSGGTSGASAQVSQNSNGCPVFPNNCQASCTSLDAKGCPICTCTKNSTSSSAGNNNGCPPFTVNCRSDCVSLNSFGCPLCSCTSGSGTGSSSTSNNTTLPAATGKQSSSQASSNNNGCPAFPTNCRTDCVELTSLGCPVCTCATSGSGTSSTGSSSSSSSSSASSSVSGYNQASQGSMSNNNGCPKFSSSCAAACTTTDDKGCPVCTCSATNQLPSTSGTTFSSSASGGSHVECPPLMPNCNIACLTTDNVGCIVCNGDCNENYKKQHNGTSLVASTTKPVTSTSNPTTGGSGGNGAGVNCAPFDPSCSSSCASFDLHGCLVCTCTVNSGGNSGTSGGNMNGCPPFDTKCPGSCADVDKNGCLTCTCNVNLNNSTSGTGSLNGTSGGSGSSVTITCAAFDAAHCNPTCIGLDTNGCLSCDCQVDVTTSSPVPSTSQGNVIIEGSTNSVNNGGYMTTVSSGVNGAGSGTGTQGNTGTGNTNSCAAYDTNCPPGCTKLDARGCLSCSCSKNKTNGMTSGSTGNGNNCPAFDTKCSADCTHIDGMGCLTCYCTGSTSAPGVGTGSHVTNGNANDCPAVDIMSCEPTCLKLDSHGCVLCTCQATTRKAMTSASMTPTTTTTTPRSITTTTTVPLTTQLQTTQSTAVLTQSCPKFDESCLHDCIIIDTRGCLGCTCQTLTTQQTETAFPVTSNPTSQVTTTFPVTTKPPTTQRPKVDSLTTQTSERTTPGMCPPIRCVYPCNAGVTLGADNCPVCKCRTDVTSSRPTA